nr:MAG TPA: hypothetical protein [Bacteriophage sp.]
MSPNHFPAYALRSSGACCDPSLSIAPSVSTGCCMS